MKSYVITIMDIPQSVKAAQNCIDSANSYGIEVKNWKAITPADNPIEILKSKDIPISGFQEVYSRLDRCVAAFLSHHSLWEYSVEHNEEILIFEHDAVVHSPINEFQPYNKLLSYGHPSYGKFNIPMKIGVNPLVSKNYLPGAHAYKIKPKGAEALIKQAKISAKPTDVFINNSCFPWIEEFYPWPVEAQDSFSTIQLTPGCLAKHQYKDGQYELI